VLRRLKHSRVRRLWLLAIFAIVAFTIAMIPAMTGYLGQQPPVAMTTLMPAEIPTTYVTTFVPETTNPSPAFDFTLQIQPGIILYSCNGKGSARGIRLDIGVISGSPQPVRLYVGSLPPEISSVSFTNVQGIPPFYSFAVIWSSNTIHPSEITGYVTFFAEGGGTVHSITVPIDVKPGCAPSI
jgi:hypothetical protein